MTRRSLASALCFLAACFQSPGSIPIRCDLDNPCPDGQQCSAAGLCAASSPADLATQPDQALASVGCANSSTGQKLSDRVWGCAGAFAVGGARALCSQGWAVCKDFGDLTATQCENTVSFYIADAPAYRVGTNPLICGATTIYQKWFGGCGAIPPFMGTIFDATCSPFRHWVVDPGSNGYSFAAGHSIDKAANTNPLTGVLCCRP